MSLASIGQDLAIIAGNDFPAVDDYVSAYDPELGSDAGAWYWAEVRGSWTHPEDNDAAVSVWHRLAEVIEAQYRLILAAGFTHTVTADDPYASPEELWADLAATGGIRTFASVPGEHPVWTAE